MQMIPHVPRIPFPPTHSDCDLAALVYDRGDEPDDLLRGFLDRRIGEGHDALGIVQSGRPRIDGPDRPPSFDLLPRFEWPEPPATLPNARPDGCRAALDRLARSLADTLPREPDVLVLNRFGRAEAAGAGFIGLLAAAVTAEVPVLIAVPRGLFPNWLRLTRGMTVRIGPSRDGLERWWRSLGYGTGATSDTERACERFK